MIAVERKVASMSSIANKSMCLTMYSANATYTAGDGNVILNKFVL